MVKQNMNSFLQHTDSNEKPPFFLIAGPCVIENHDTTCEVARVLQDLTKRLGIPLIFKASFDKANRTAFDAFRGPGMTKALKSWTK